MPNSIIGGSMPAKKVEKLKTDELLGKTKSSLEAKSYYFTSHALQRSKQRRNISELEVIKILKSESKYHEAKKDSFSKDHKAWNYSIRGKSIDSEDIC
jgi:hypothetical protein